MPALSDMTEHMYFTLYFDPFCNRVSKFLQTQQQQGVEDRTAAKISGTVSGTVPVGCWIEDLIELWTGQLQTDITIRQFVLLLVLNIMLPLSHIFKSQTFIMMKQLGQPANFGTKHAVTFRTMSPVNRWKKQLLRNLGKILEQFLAYLSKYNKT